MIKQKITFALGSLMTGILIPVIEVLLFTGFVIFLDTLTGIWAAQVRGEELNSKKAKGVISKLVIYPLVIILASFAERLIPEIPFIKGGAVLLIAVEGTSILENMRDILGQDLLKIIRVYIMDGKKGVADMLKNKSSKNGKANK